VKKKNLSIVGGDIYEMNFLKSDFRRSIVTALLAGAVFLGCYANMKSANTQATTKEC
jgi:hypothetical protein